MMADLGGVSSKLSNSNFRKPLKIVSGSINGMLCNCYEKPELLFMAILKGCCRFYMLTSVFPICRIYYGGSTVNSGKEDKFHMLGRIVYFK